MATEAQIQANRRNATRSTGPSTDDGKLRSSQNAVRHGGYATRDLAIRTGAFKEDPDEIASFIETLVSALAPRDELEQQEAHSIATIYLRSRRINSFEAQSMARTELIPSPRPYVSDLWLDPFGQDAYEATEQDVRFGEETRRISMALQMMETVLTVATRVESLNTSLLDHALKRYQALQTRDLDDRSPISTAAEVTIVYPPSEIDNRLSRGQ